MSNEVRIAVTGTNTSGASVNTAKRDVKDLGDEAQKTAKRVVELGAAEEVAGSGAKGLGKETKKTAEELAAAKAAARQAATAAFDLANRFDGAGDQASQLARKLLEAKAAAKLAADEFDGTEAAVKRFSHAQSELSRLSAVAKKVDAPGGNGRSLFDSVFGSAPKVAEKAGKEAAGTFASAFEGGLMGTFKALPPEAKAALGASLAGVAIAATPFIVSAVNGAILGGIGVGGLAAGIAIQAKDPVVAGAFKQLGGRIMGDLTTATKPFKGELLSSADTFGASWTKILPNVTGFFSKIAPSVSVLATGASKAVEQLGPALERAAGPASKVLEAVADELPEIGNAVGNLLDAISKHGESAAAAIKFILFNVEALITGFELLVDTVGPAADVIVELGKSLHLIDDDHLTKSIQDIERSTSDLGSTSEDTAASVDYMNRSVYNTADAADQANEAIGRLFGEMMGLDEANLKVAEDFRQLSSALKKSNGDLREGTEAGDRNRGMILGMVQDLEQQRQAAIAAGNGTLEATQKANAAYLAQLQKLRQVAVAAGASTAAIDALIGKYQKLANQPDITKRITIINTAVYKVVGTPTGNTELGRGLSRDRAVGGVVGAAATGGARDGLTWVGEEGPELVSLPAGTSVYTAGASRRMAGGPGGGGDGGSAGLWIGGDPNSWLYQAVMQGVREGKVFIRESAIVS